MQHCQSSVKQEGLTLMAEQTQALKLLSEGRDGLLLPGVHCTPATTRRSELRHSCYYLSKEAAALWTLVSGSCLAKDLKISKYSSFLMQEIQTKFDWLSETNNQIQCRAEPPLRV